MIGDNVTKPTENYEQLIQRFTKRTMQLNARQDEIKSWYDEYVKNENDLKRLEGSMQAIQYVAYGKMPGDGNHDNSRITPQKHIRQIYQIVTNGILDRIHPHGLK